MTARELLSYLQQREIKLWAEGDRLRVAAPQGGLPPELRAELVKHKAAILAMLQAAQRAATAKTIPPLRPRDTHEASAPLSFAQQRLWFLDQFQPNNPAYHIPFALRLHGRLDRHALERSLAVIVARHELLRTNFPLIDGQPQQAITRPQSYPIATVDLQQLRPAEREHEVQHVIADEAQRPFDLAQGPLLRVTLLRIAPQEHILILVFHHIIFDGWSTQVLIRELSALYTACQRGVEDLTTVLPPLPIQYADYALWQRDWLQGEALEQQLDYWRKQLAHSTPILNLAGDRPRPPLPSGRGAAQPVIVSGETTEALQALSQRSGATLFMTVLAAWAAALGRWSNQDDILVGAPIANRTRAEIEGLIGFFANTLVLRADLQGNPSFVELVERVRDVCLGAYAHQELPFDLLVDALQPARSTSHTPLFQVLFSLQGESTARVELPDVVLTPLDVPPVAAKFDLSLILSASAEGLRGTLEYNTDIFDAPTAARMARQFETLLDGIAANCERRLIDLPLLNGRERQQLLDRWGATRAYPAAQAIHQLFETHAARAPQQVALVYENEQLSYAALNRRANQLAHKLRSLGVGPEVRVGLCVERSLDLVVGILAILKAGGAYVPIDPAYPSERIQLLLHDSRAGVLLTQQALLDRLEQAERPDVPTVCLDRDEPTMTQQPTHNPDVPVLPENVAYVIYTSGSTGKPKGVLVSHANVTRLLAATDEWFHFAADDVWTLFHSASFDFSVWELWGALCYGGRLVIVPYLTSRSPDAFYQLVREQHVTVLNQTPSAFRQFIQADAQAASPELALRLVIFGGEALDLQSLQPWFERHGDQRPQLVNMYGITETTVHVTYRPLSQADLSGAPGSMIGSPIPDLQLYILDQARQPVPIGVAGELYVGGAGVARGYLGRPELTAERFVPHPFSRPEGTQPGARLYRTGDLARMSASGDIEYLGRIDQQVKVRGFRIELGEIESVLAQYPGVQDAVVLARSDSAGETRLVAYITLPPAAADDPDAAPDISSDALRSFLRGHLPEHMIPAAFVTLDALPLTEHGKIDRRALPEPDMARPMLKTAFAPPSTPVEHTLAAIWSEVLGVEPIGIDDNYFALGGDSIRTIQILARAREQGLSFTLPQIFQHQTIRSLAREVSGSVEPVQPTPASEPFSLITEADRARLPEDVEDAYPLTMLQAGMLFHGEYQASSAVYHNVNTLRLHTRLDENALRAAAQALAARHPVLRTSFDLTSFSEPLQLVHRQVEIPLEVVDLRHLTTEQQDGALAAWFEAEKQRQFDWSRAPLLHLRVHIRGDETFDFCWSEHHAILDGWSVASMLTELFQHYAAQLDPANPRPAPAPSATFRDFVALERAALNSPAMAQFWREKLGDATILALPPRALRDADRPADPTTHLLLDQDLADGLKQLAGAAGVPLKSVVLAAHLRVMALLGGTDDVLTGLVANGRAETLDGERVLGLFLNTLPLRQQLPGGTWRELLRETFASEQQLLLYRRYPMAQIQRLLGGQPLFEIAFNYVHFHVYQQIHGASGLSVGEGSGYEQTNFTLMATFSQDVTTSGLHLILSCDPDKISQSQIESIQQAYIQVLTLMASQPDSRYHDRPLLSAAEQQQLRDWNATATDYPQRECLHTLIEAQAAATPEAVALLCEGEQLTYRMLNQRAEQLASYLQTLGVGPEVVVGLCMERSLELVVSMVAILKAGGAYLPLDPHTPGQRLQFMLQDAESPVLLTQQHLAGALPDLSQQVICVDSDWPMIADAPRRQLRAVVTPDQLAYVIYTSGSTGTPKGVMNSHRGIVNRLLWGQQSYGLSPADRVLQKTPYSFDVSVWEFFWPLISGATLVLAKPEGHKDSAYLVDLIESQQITVMHFVPAMLQVFLQEPDLQRCRSLRRVFCSGEALPYELQQRFFATFDAELHNLYGPTEAAVEVTFWECQRSAPEPSVPIGRPVANTQIHLLNRHLQPVPIGVAGELHIGGVQVARGYLKRPELTAEKFIPDPFSTIPGARLYKSGDLARWRADGAIEYLGRIDHQVKVRGFRIELGEIEARLAEHPAVRDAVVVTRQDAAGDRRLVAYVVEEQGSKGTGNQSESLASELRQFLQAALPEYMVPAAFLVLESFPLTTSGKVNRNALPAPDWQSGVSDQSYVAPRNPSEELIAQIWAGILQLERVGVHDEFFALGGHSLLATQVVSRLRETFQLDLPLRALFDAPTVAGLAEQIEALRWAAQGSELIPLRPVPRDQRLPLSFAQQRLWFLDQLQPGSSSYNMYVAVRLTGRLNVEALSHCLNTIVARHETLRTTFAAQDDEPVQLIAPAMELPLPLIDLSDRSPAEREAVAQQLAMQEAAQPFDLQQGPLLRAALLRLEQEQHIVLLTMHHIVSDGWSLGVLVQELATLYAAFAGDRSTAALPELPIQYADYAAWQRQLLSGPAREQHLNYWRRQLADPVALALPTDRPRPAIPSFNGATESLALSQELTQALHRLSRSEGMTLFITLLAGFQALLSRYSGQDDILVGTPIANRTRAEIEPLIGFFVNMLVMRTDLSGDPSVHQLLRRVRETAIGAYAHQDLPFEMLVEELQPERNLSINPLFQVGFTLQNTPMAELELPDLTLQQMNIAGGTAKFDLSLFLREVPDGLVGVIEYSTDLFDPPTIKRLIDHYRMLLEQMVLQPEQPVAALPIVTDEERRQVLTEWNATQADFSLDPCVHELFAAQAERTPDAIAVVFEDQQMSYRELNARANQLAHKLRSLGVGASTRVGLCVERSLELVVGLLGIFKAGGCYVPLDPAYPAERLHFMLHDSEVPVLLTQEHLVAELPPFQGTLLCLDTDWPQIATLPRHNPTTVSGPEDLAYIIYTSGSTGQPKGVLVEQRQLTNTLRASQAAFQFRPDDRMPWIASFAFDIALFELFCPLLAGGTSVVLARQHVLDLPRFVDTLAGMTRLHTLPSLMQQIVQYVQEHGLVERFDSMRQLFVGGDAVPPDLLERMQASFRRARINVLYGPTEAAIICATYAVPQDQILPKHFIGKPLGNCQLRIYDQQRQLVPIGVPGELFIGGAGVTRGYLHREELTADKYVAIDGQRWYRSGDLARFLPDGTIEYLGRIDQQVKIRGFRIELGEIEAVMREHPAIGDALVVTRDDQGGDKQLVGYLVPDLSADHAVQSVDESLLSEQVADWQHVFDSAYSEEDDPTFNISGWNSSYTGQPIPASEMRIWVEQTVERILELRPQRVLEIGCGTGLLLFPLAPHCEQYVGTDFSATTLQHLERQVRRQGLSQVVLRQQAADDHSGLEAGQFDVVIINSVVQYFPSIDYLLEVLEGAVALVAPGGRIFVGDVRSLPLLESFHASVEIAQAPASLSTARLRQRIRSQMAREQELLLDPTFFPALAQHLPQIAQVQIQPKRGRYTNEISKFRYDVTLHIGTDAATAAPLEWLNWEQDELTLAALRQRLQADAPARLAVTRIPNARLSQENHSLRLLAQPDAVPTLRELREALESLPPSGVAPDDLWELGDELGYKVGISWADASPDGALTAVFQRHAVDASAALPPVRAERLRPWHTYANNPLQAKLERQIVPLMQRYLAERLPEYMLPSALVVLDAFPLTHNGKLDRKALPEPTWTSAVELSPETAPRTPIEMLLAGIWQQLLGLPAVGIHDNFFALGGHSLLATQVISRIRSALGVDLPVRALFEHPTIMALSQALVAAQRESQSLPALPPLVAGTPQTAVPLSFAQQRLWFIEQLQPGTASYHLSGAWHVQGDLHLDALQASLDTVVARHGSLRTTFALSDEQPVQTIAPAQSLPIARIDLSELAPAEQEAEVRRFVRREAGRPFDLSRGPLLRAALLRLRPDQHVLVLILHHIITDGWSMGILVKELVQLYTRAVTGQPADLPTLPIQYVDYALWQRTWLQGEILEQQLDYWRKQLAGVPALQLPTDHPRPPVQSHRGANAGFSLDPMLVERLEDLSRQTGTTLFMVLLAAWQVLMARYSGQNDIAVGTPIAGRTQPETEELIGFFVNTLVLRTEIAPSASFRELLARVRTTTLDAYAHQDAPFEAVVEAVQPERDLSRQPLFQVMFALANTPMPEINLPEIKLSALNSGGGTAMFDLTLNLFEASPGLNGQLEYALDLFEPATIQQLIEHFQTLLKAIAADPDQRIASLPLLTAAEQQQILHDWNQSAADYPRSAAVHELIEAQAARSPERPAIVFEGAALTYAELNERANQLAHELQALGVGPDVLVALCVERSLEMIVGMLAILKAGGAYLPLDPAYPAERLQYMLAHSQARVILTQERLVSRLPEHQARVFRLDADWPTLAQQPRSNPARVALPDHLAYLIYTSGSTGRPKGVMVRQQGLINLVYGLHAYFDDPAVENTGLITSISFDISVNQIFPTLIFGRTLHIISDEVKLDSRALLRYLDQQQIHLLDAVPSYMQVVLNDVAPEQPANTLRYLLIGGEKLEQRLLQSIFGQLGPSVNVVNIYGLTEISDINILGVIRSADLGKPVTVGKPLQNNRIYIVNQGYQPQPVGVAGEVCVAGESVSRGYLFRPELTAERFVVCPFEDGQIMVRTGDLGRWRADGTVEILGRIDHQVKVRGFRIETGEIEAVLVTHPQVNECVVVARDDIPGGRQLIGYISAREGMEAPPAAELRRLLGQHLPEYMIPATFVTLDALPKTPSGKTDRKALPAPEAAPSELARDYVGPRTSTEAALAEIWAGLLQVERIGVHDNFFRLGGHSLLAIRLVEQIRKRFGQSLPVAVLFEDATIAHIAQRLDEQHTASWSPLVPIQPRGSKPPLFCVHGLGGSVLGYAELARALGPSQPLYGLQARGLEADQEPQRTIPEMAAAYVEALRSIQPQGPYFLSGWSLGGVIALEMARMLHEQGETIALLALLDSTPLQRPTRQHQDRRDILLELLQGYDFMDSQVLQSGQFEEVLAYAHQQAQIEDPQQWKHIDLPQFRRIVELSIAQMEAAYRHTPGEYRESILVLAAAERMRGSNQAADAIRSDWQRCTRADVEVLITPGNHWTMLQEPQVQSLAEILALKLDQAQTALMPFESTR